jgi:hypothetical protein
LTDLLTPLPGLSRDLLHRSFVSLIEADVYKPARELLREVWRQLPNPDEHFIREFQTTGFDARIWELIIGSVGLFGPYTLSRPEVAPDFLFEKDGHRAWIEVTTAGKSRLSDALSSLEGAYAEQLELINNVLPIRLGSCLYSKLQKNYSQLPHVVGDPLVIAVSDFGQDEAVRFTDSALVAYLYGLEHKVVSLPDEPVRLACVKIESHQHGDKVIPSAFFDQPGAESISAVIFANDGTLPKFNRLGFDRERHHGVRMVRVGVMVDFDPAAVVPAPFVYLVGTFEEDWGHGMSVYFNPRASNPLPLDFFKEFSARHWFIDGTYDNAFREFHPYTSVTITCPTVGFRDRLDVVERWAMSQAERVLAGWSTTSSDLARLPWAGRIPG